jgi:hypothetical protein
VRARGSPARPRPVRRARRTAALPGDARIGGGTARRAGCDSAPAYGRRRGWRLTDAETAARRDGHGRRAGTARRPAAVRATRLRTTAVDERRAWGAVERARSAGQDGAVGGRGRARRCRDARRVVPTVALSRAVGVAATRQWRAAVQARLGARRLTSGARLSVISELKFTPKEISSN